MSTFLTMAVQLQAACGNPSGDLRLCRMQEVLEAVKLAGGGFTAGQPAPVEQAATAAAPSVQPAAAAASQSVADSGGSMAVAVAVEQHARGEEAEEGSCMHIDLQPAAAGQAAQVAPPSMLAPLPGLAFGSAVSREASPEKAPAAVAPLPAPQAIATSTVAAAAAEAGSAATEPAVAAVAATAAAGEADMSESDSDGEEPDADSGWLGAVFAAQKRVMGGGSTGGRQAKRRAVERCSGAPAGASAAPGVDAGRAPGRVGAQAAPAPSAADNADALSIGDSLPGGAGVLGFLGL